MYEKIIKLNNLITFIYNIHLKNIIIYKKKLGMEKEKKFITYPYENWYTTPEIKLMGKEVK